MEWENGTIYEHEVGAGITFNHKVRYPDRAAFRRLVLSG